MKNRDFYCFRILKVDVFILLINVKILKVVKVAGILTFFGMINLMLSLVEHEKSFITSKPGLSESKLGPHATLLILSLTHTFMVSWTFSRENLSLGYPTK